MDGTNFTIHEQALQYQWSGDCFLSIKSFYEGDANYCVYQREYRVMLPLFLGVTADQYFHC